MIYVRFDEELLLNMVTGAVDALLGTEGISVRFLYTLWYLHALN